MLRLLRGIYRLFYYLTKMLLRIGFAVFFISWYYIFEYPRRRLAIGVQVHPGSPQATGLWCIFAVSQNTKLSQNLIKTLSCFHLVGYNVILINNGRGTKEFIEASLPYCHTVILKPYGGRDFGGYKWGTEFLEANNGSAEILQVIYCNDSVFIRPSTFLLLLEQIKQTDQNYIGITEIFEIHYHVQSWFFAVSGKLFCSAVFQNFWRRYTPYSHRTHCIYKGEVGLGLHLLRAGFSPQILYTQTKILDLIFSNSTDIWLDRLMISLRPAEYDRLSKTIKELIIPQHPHNRSVVSVLRRELLERLAMSNTMSNANLILLQFSGFPFLKKDLVYRAQYFVSQVDHTIADWTDTDAAELPEILAFFRRRGTLRWRYSFPAILARFEVI